MNGLAVKPRIRNNIEEYSMKIHVPVEVMMAGSPRSTAVKNKSGKNFSDDYVETVRKRPASFVKSTAVKDVVAFMKFLDDAYYNNGEPVVPDSVYDKLWEALAEKDPSNPYLRKVGAPVRTNRSSVAKVTRAREKVKLPYHLPSLTKIRPGTSQAESWYRGGGDSWVVSDKLDGVSLLLVYSVGKVSAYTRGDATHGQNVSTIIDSIPNIPKRLRESAAVRGELIVDKAVFESKYSKEKLGDADGFSSARSLIVGSVNRLETSDALRHARFIAYEVISPSGKTPESQMTWLKDRGFTVVPYTVQRVISDAKLTSLLKQRKAASKFDIDGLVVARNQSYTRTNADRPSYAVAYKDNELVEHKTATVVDVVWRTTRTGVLAPRVMVKQISLGGSSISYFSGFNAYFIEHGYPYKDRDLPENRGKKFPIGPGAKIDAVKSGDVIPYIVRVLKPATKPKLPSVPYSYDANKINVIAKSGSSGSTSGKEADVAALLHFMRTINVTDVGIGFATKLVDNNIRNPKDLLKLTVPNMVSRLGLTDTTANKIHSSLKNRVHAVSLATLGDALDSFGRGVGSQKLEVLFSEMPGLLSQRMETAPDRLRLAEKIQAIPSFSEVTAAKIIEGLPAFKKDVLALGRSLSQTVPKKVSSKLSGEVVLFSKIRDKALEETIVKNGGKVATSLRSDVTVLIVKDPSDSSSKIEGARSKGIPITTIEKFKAKHKI